MYVTEFRANYDHSFTTSHRNNILVYVQHFILRLESYSHLNTAEAHRRRILYLLAYPQFDYTSILKVISPAFPKHLRKPNLHCEYVYYYVVSTPVFELTIDISESLSVTIPWIPGMLSVEWLVFSSPYSPSSSLSLRWRKIPPSATRTLEKNEKFSTHYSHWSKVACAKHQGLSPWRAWRWLE